MKQICTSPSCSRSLLMLIFSRFLPNIQTFVFGITVHRCICLCSCRLDFLKFLSLPTEKGPLNLESSFLESLLLSASTSYSRIYSWLGEEIGQKWSSALQWFRLQIPSQSTPQHSLILATNFEAATTPPSDLCPVLQQRTDYSASQNNLQALQIEIYKESCHIFS